MLYLLDKDVKTVKWNGIPLHEASSAIVKEETNGDFTLTVRYPITDSGIYQLIKEDMLIKAPAPVLGAQLFRIKKPVENDDSLDITAYHISDDVMQRSINPLSVVGQGCAMALSQMVQNAKTDLGTFSFTSDIMDSRTFNTTETETLYTVLMDGKHSIVGTWEGELVRDNFALTIKRSRGADRGVVITTHKNLKSYQRTKNSQNVVTRIHARSTFRAEGAEEETNISITVDSPLIGNYPYINEKEYQNNDIHSVEELRKWAERKFKYENIDKPTDEIKIEAYELDGQVVHLGDTVNIKSRKHDVDLYKKAIAYEYNALTEEYISITFDDKPGVGGSGVSSGVSNAADVILGLNANAQEVSVERAIRNANQAFDAEFEKRVESINDGIEQAQAEAERYADAIKQEIDTEIAQANQSMQAQSEEHDREVANILSKTQSVESLANQAKSDAASALARANQVKTEAIADARAQVATVSQALNTAKSELQTAIASADQKARDSQASATALRNDLNLQASKILAQAQAQTALTNRVSTVETLADGTRSTVADLSKTVSKATGDITSVTSRTKTVEDTLSQTRTQYEALTQTVNTQTGQIDSINRKTADLQSGIDGVTERFDSLRIEDNLLLNSSFNENLNQWQGTGVTIVDGKARITGELNKTKHIYQSIKSQIANDDVSQVYIASISVKVTNYVAGSINPFLALYISGRKNDSVKTWFGATYLTAARLEAVNNRGVVQFTTTFKVNVPRSQIGSIEFHIYARDFTGEVEFEKVSLRRGNIDLGWQASPEDLRSEIATYKRTADEASAELSRQIQLADGKAVDAKTYAQQTATAINTRLESLETYKNAEGARVEQYLTASRDETARQLTAERTAIATNYVAKSTYDENVRGTTLKLNEVKTTADTAKQNLATYQNTVDRKLEELTSSTQTLDGKINTASAKVDTVAGQIRTEISEVEGKIPTEIGGNNLLINNKMATYSGHSMSSRTTERLAGRGAWYIEYKVDFKPNTDYTLSCESIVKNNGDFNNLRIRIFDSSVTIKKMNWLDFNGLLNFRTSDNIVSGDKLLIYVSYSNVSDYEIIKLKLEETRVKSAYSPAPEDLIDELSSVKTTITQTASGVEQLSTSLTTTDSKVTTAEAKIRQLISDVSSKVSQTDYNTLTGRVDSAETAITQNAQEISRRLTSTQVESAITGKGYQTKSDVDSNITGRGYITNSALQPYALSTTVQNLVKETADSFSRTISETKALIPTEIGGTNLLVNSQFFRYSSHAMTSQTTEALTGRGTYYIGYIVNLKPNTVYTLSAEVVTKTETGNFNGFIVRIYNSAVSAQKGDEIVWFGKSTFTTAENVEAGDKLLIYPSYGISVNYDIRNIKLEEGSVKTAWSLAPEDLATVTALHSVRDTVDSHTRTISTINGTVSTLVQTAAGLVTEVSGTNGLKTQVGQLKNSWAVKISGPEGLKTAINASEDGVRLKGKNLWLDGNTLINDAVITSAMIGELDAGKITSGTVDAARIKANSIDGSKIAFDEAFFNGLSANQAYLKKLFAKDAFLTAVQAVNLSAKQIAGGIAKALNGGMDVNFDESKINFYTNVAAIRRIYTGHPTQFIKFETEGNYSRTIIGSNRNGGEVFNSATFAGIVVENTNNINTEDNVRVYGDNTLFRHAQGDVGWNINSVTQRIVPANMNAESEIWSKHFVAPDKNSKPVRLDTAVAALWDIWNHIIYNNFEFNEALRTHIKARRDNWKFELNL
ncbi:phage tail spike protein [Streptococcus suis]|uniref:phage tail spike protein n=2 Tax=Streptococcus suis TaxID=1307 RepID=UPI002117F90E|nr:phage tail spike protein [Streptococcus suis]MCQ8272412.1 gp58-like family protein [Streptococcus suis]UUM48607.1 gp58-like family protein [Streptococcus suis]HEL2596795.1 hypothetical protein [Streptococcus suis]HEM2639408.1 hypothetical protein [Streptococcus suis]